MPFLFDHQLTIDNTPNYFTSEAAAKRIHEMNPKMKFVVVIRNPVTRAVSHFTHDLKYRWNKDLVDSLKKFNSTSSLFEALVLDETGYVRPFHYYIAYGLYLLNYKHWLKFFPQKQFLFIDGENLIKNPFEEVKTLETFLELKPFIQQSIFVYDKKKGFYCVKNKPENKTDCMGENKGREHAFINSWVLDKLDQFYNPYSLELFRMLNRRPFWKINESDLFSGNFSN